MSAVIANLIRLDQLTITKNIYDIMHVLLAEHATIDERCCSSWMA